MDQQYEDFKRQVKDSSDIVDVIASYISLQKKGRYYWACCPFHGEKTPSFCVEAVILAEMCLLLYRRLKTVLFRRR